MSNQQVIRYRAIINDAMCFPWEDMPEIKGTTLTALMNYLRSECGISPEPLTGDSWWGEGFVVRYGLRKQFWLPEKPTDEEVQLMESFHKIPEEKIPCPICSNPMGFTTDIRVGDHEEYHSMFCESCDIKISRYREIAWTPSQIASVLKRKI